MYPGSMEAAKEFRVTPIAAEVHSATDIETIMTDLGAAPAAGSL